MIKLKTYRLALEFYKEGRKLKIKNFPLKNQFERASLSIVLNIAEGVAKLSAKDRKRFYQISLGSLNETLVILEIMENNILIKKGNLVRAHLINLIKNPGGFS